VQDEPQTTATSVATLTAPIATQSVPPAPARNPAVPETSAPTLKIPPPPPRPPGSSTQRVDRRFGGGVQATQYYQELIISPGREHMAWVHVRNQDELDRLEVALRNVGFSGSVITRTQPTRTWWSSYQSILNRNIISDDLILSKVKLTVPQYLLRIRQDAERRRDHAALQDNQTNAQEEATQQQRLHEATRKSTEQDAIDLAARERTCRNWMRRRVKRR
jgi:hypothetical protein